MGIPAEDQRIVREEFEQTIVRLNTQEHTAKHPEAQLKRFFRQVKSGTFDSVEEIISGIAGILPASTPRLSAGHRVCFSSDVKTPGDSLRSTTGVFLAPRQLQKQFRTFKKSPFTASHVVPFFEAMIAQFSPEIKELFGYMSALFWFQLHEFIHIKAVLVNTKTKEALITRLDVTTSLEPKGLDTLDVESIVDDRMYRSCWNGVQAARAFLEDQFSDTLKNQSLHVVCRFPNPVAVQTYRS